MLARVEPEGKLRCTPGTEVAKGAADLVLADDSLATVTAAVAEARRVFEKVRPFVGCG